MPRRSALSLALLTSVAFSSGAIAGVECTTRFELFASPGDSLNFSLALPLAGTFIGDWDPVDNPGGTRTRPGLFGGSGNNPIAYTSTVKPELNLNLPTAVPVFTFCVKDLGGGVAEVTCTEFDLVRGSPAPLTINLTISYPNFNTVQPTAVFPGVSNVTLPIPAGSITEALVVQTKPAQGALVPGVGESLILTAVVPAELSFVASLLGQPIEVPPSPIALPIVAELFPTLTGDYIAVVAIEIPATETDVPTGGQTIENVPFDLPTLLPPGAFAHLLFSGTFSDGTLSFALSADLSGEGSTSGPLGDLNGDCIVNGADLAILLGQWGTCTGCAADLNNDGAVNGADIAILLGNWG
ncbi:MAG: hypothetical protein KF724_00830 [Phycisphaeraceae bacterium]|nr:hypothetical protein [Phycisphaeraceae bacterium]